MQINEEISQYLKSYDYSAGEHPCYKCRWFVPCPATLDDLDDGTDLDCVQGRCRRFPPLSRAQSSVNPLDTCGEWTERNQPHVQRDGFPDSNDEPLTAAARHEIAEQIRDESDSEDGGIYVPSLSMIVSGRSYGPNHLDGNLLASLIDA